MFHGTQQLNVLLEEVCGLESMLEQVMRKDVRPQTSSSIQTQPKESAVESEEPDAPEKQPENPMQSIPVHHVTPLLQRLHRDFPDWDGTSSTLSVIFRTRKIDPRTRHAEYYAETKPTLAASYVWSMTSLGQIAAECSKPVHRSKLIFIDVLLVPQYEATSRSTVKKTREIYGSCELLLFLNGLTLTRAWCLFELAVNQFFFKGAMHVVGTIEVYDGGFFEGMEASVEADKEMLRDMIEFLFGEGSSFDEIVRRGVGRAKGVSLYVEGLALEEKAWSLFEQAAELGVEEAREHLGGLSAALEMYRKNRLAAERGDATAQNVLANMYRTGEGVKKDEAEAVKWYRLSAEQGNPSGQNGLGFMYHFGLGVAVDYVEAAKWYKLAVDQGMKEAQHNLGTLYHVGQGVGRDVDRARELFKLAAAQGHEGAKKNLAAL